MDPEYASKQAFANYLVGRITDTMSGKGVEGEYCLYNRPRDLYPIGSLSPRPEEIPDDDELFQTDFLSRYAPYSMGMEFRVRPDNDMKIEVEVQANLYYRIYPDYRRQTELASRELAVVFKRIKMNKVAIEVGYEEVAATGRVIIDSQNNTALRQALERVYNRILSDSATIRNADHSAYQWEDLSESEFSSQIAEFADKEKVIPHWDLEIHVGLRRSEDGAENIQVTLVNSSEEEYDRNRFRDLYLFDVRLSIIVFNGKLVPYKFNLLRESYRFNRDMWGMGTNCVVDQDGENRLKAEAVPIYKQLRYGTREKLPDGERLVKAEFGKLAEDPLPVLEKLKKQMVEYKRCCLAKPQVFLERAENEDDYGNFTESLERFQEEIDRFEQGISLLGIAKEEDSKYHIVYRAFKYLNETFLMMSKKKEKEKEKEYNSWRPFQIVFIVSHLIDIAGQHWVEDFREKNGIDKVSVLWFPTGGGKTEAYLALTIFNLFFDRLRRKEGGMTALFRFPLRILSYQQFQRVFETLYVAGEVKDKYGLPGKTFSIGHWVGNNQTPNSTSNAEWKGDLKKLANGAASDEEMNRIQTKLKRIHRCPACRGNIKVEWSNNLSTVLHKCADCNKIMPIYIIDTDIYGYLPSVVVSTVDKVAVLGLQKSFSNILGDVRYYSPTKGYSWKEEDWEDGRTVDLEERRLLRPTLQIQDELHLLKEDLGAYDSHYETMMQTLIEQITGNYSWKVVASTATIQDYNRHASHLYGKEEHLQKSIRFPVEGPKYDDSFYSCKDEDESVGRYYVGIMGHNKTHINTIVEVIYNFHKTVKKLRKLELEDFNRETGLTLLSKKKMEDLLDDYEIGLNYVLTKRNADQIAESIGSQIADYLNESDLSGINNVMLTGGTEPEQLSTVMDEVEKEYRGKRYDERTTSITATSMISHGVDVDRFNFMTFFGIPRQTAEYIQASSRIGRKSPGISIVVFAPQKERDQSYFRYFSKYHEYLERLVEVPAINRWAKYSINKTFPGILFGFILNRYNRSAGRNFYYTNAFKEYVREQDRNDRGRIKREVLDFVKRSYVADYDDGVMFNEVVNENVENFFEYLNRPRHKELQSLMESLFGDKPMRSLRDTEEENGFFKSEELESYSEEIDF